MSAAEIAWGRGLLGLPSHIGTQRQPLRVLMLSDVYFPRINGVSTSIQTFRAALAQQGVNVTVVAPRYPDDGGDDLDPGIIRMPSRAVPFDPEDRLMHWSTLAGKERRLASTEFDLVHIQTPFAAHYAGLRLARSRGVPCLASYHTHFEEYLYHYIRFLPRSWLRYAARALARHQCTALDAVVVPSQPMADRLRSYGVTSPLRVIPTGLPESQFVRGDGMRFRAAWGIAADQPMALYVGRAAFEKNIGFLLEMLAAARRRRPDLVLVVAGAGPALPALQEQAAQLGIAANVRFVGYLPRESGLRDCYAAADVFTFASCTETQGLVLLEAMAIGLPVLAMAALGAAEIVAPQRGAIAAAATPTAFADQLLGLLAAPELRRIMAEAAIAFAREWDAHAQGVRLAALYRELAGAPVSVDFPQTAAAPS